MKRRLFLMAAAAVVLTATGLRAQTTHPLVGKWTIEFQRGQRMEDGRVTPIMGSGELVVSARGDSLLATLTTFGTRPDGSVSPPAVMSGTADGGQAVFVHRTTAQLNLNGEARSVDAVTTWTLKVAGDALEGSMLREIKDVMLQVPMEPSPVKGKRAM
ncbi:MAG: hypothetical protein IPK85_13445 [Gemmatimonadetes bacterium]|nr:hypothetical protein [Gemmatimonadota bacterium]